MKIFSPVTGTVRDLTAVPDPVMNSLMLGPGLAIYPTDSTATLVSPAEGRVATVKQHAIIVAAETSVLLHAGIDTFKIPEGLAPRVGVGDPVEHGTPVLDMDVDRIAGEGLDTAVVVTVLGEKEHTLTLHVADGDHVEAGQVVGEFTPEVKHN